MAIKKLQEVEGRRHGKKQHWPSWPMPFLHEIARSQNQTLPGWYPKIDGGYGFMMCFLPQYGKKTSGNSLVKNSPIPAESPYDECNQLRIVTGLSHRNT